MTHPHFLIQYQSLLLGDFFGDSDHGSVGKFKPDWMALERRILHSITVSVKWLLSQPVSSYCSAKMEMRWKSGGDFNLGQLEFKEKDGKSN